MKNSEMDYLESKDDRLEEYQKWLKEKSKESSLLVSNIVLDGETVFIKQVDSNIKSVRIIKEGALFADIPIIEKYGLTPLELFRS